MFGKKVIVTIHGMNCEHCKRKVEENLKKIENVKSVKVSLEDKNATISYKDNLDLERVKAVIEELDYQYIGVE